jgi:hypothetical protein
MRSNPKLETPAFAGAASRRQAKFETNSNVQKDQIHHPYYPLLTKEGMKGS